MTQTYTRMQSNKVKQVADEQQPADTAQSNQQAPQVEVVQPAEAAQAEVENAVETAQNAQPTQVVEPVVDPTQSTDEMGQEESEDQLDEEMIEEAGDEGGGKGKQTVALVMVGLLLFGAAMIGSYMMVSRTAEAEDGVVMGVKDEDNSKSVEINNAKVGTLGISQTSEDDTMPTVSPTPSGEPTPTLSITPTITPVADDATPTNRSVNPPVVSVTYPTENQDVNLDGDQDLCVVDTPVGGDQSGMERRWKLNGGDWEGWHRMESLCLRPNEGLNKLEMQYKNSYGEESGVYVRNFSFHRVNKMNVTFKAQFYEEVDGEEGLTDGDVLVPDVKVSILNSSTYEDYMLQAQTDNKGEVEFMKEMKDTEQLPLEVQVYLEDVNYTFEDGADSLINYYILSDLNDEARNKVVVWKLVGK